jgi:hypothetical protein
MTSLELEILNLLEREDLSAEQIRHQLSISHERLYLALVRMEATGRLEIVPTFSARQRTCCRWRSTEALA